MATFDTILETINQHRAENRSEFDRLSEALMELSRATTAMATAASRMQERHERHDDAMRVVNKQVEDHETRLRLLERVVTNSIASAHGGWRTITIAASVGAFLVYVILSFYPG